MAKIFGTEVMHDFRDRGHARFSVQRSGLFIFVLVCNVRERPIEPITKP